MENLWYGKPKLSTSSSSSHFNVIGLMQWFSTVMVSRPTITDKGGDSVVWPSEGLEVSVLWKSLFFLSFQHFLLDYKRM